MKCDDMTLECELDIESRSVALFVSDCILLHFHDTHYVHIVLQLTRISRSTSEHRFCQIISNLLIQNFLPLSLQSLNLFSS